MESDLRVTLNFYLTLSTYFSISLKSIKVDKLLNESNSIRAQISLLYIPVSFNYNILLLLGRLLLTLIVQLWHSINSWRNMRQSPSNSRNQLQLQNLRHLIPIPKRWRRKPRRAPPPAKILRMNCDYSNCILVYLVYVSKLYEEN